jgi:hypothetical protein
MERVAMPRAGQRTGRVAGDPCCCVPSNRIIHISRCHGYGSGDKISFPPGDHRIFLWLVTRSLIYFKGDVQPSG